MTGETKDLRQYAESFIFYNKNVLEDELCKFQIVKLGEEDYRFTLCLHHAIADGVTIGLFIEKLSRRYNAIAGRTDVPLEKTYFDLVKSYGLTPGQWSHQEKRFWTAQLSCAAEPAVFPPDYGGLGSARKRSVIRTIDSRNFQRINQQATNLQVSAFHFVYGAYLLALARHTGSDQVVSAFQSSGRRRKADAKNTLGLFSNAFVLRAKLLPDEPYAEFEKDKTTN